MCGKLVVVGLAVWPSGAWGQKPVISPGGVVNAASYSTLATSTGVHNLAGGSIAVIFGTNLATSTVAATTIPLETSLAGTSVSVNGILAPLFYVSPNQINFQVPSPWLQAASTGAVNSDSGILVTTAAGSSDPYPFGGADSSLGIFTLNSSGCGQGAILNVNSEGSLPLNSPTNSVSPGDYLAAYGTGLGMVYGAPPDGSPAGSPATGASGAAGVYDFVEDGSETSNWDGRAPGLIGVDQFNVRVPETTREGCAVPFQVLAGLYGYISQPVPIAVRNGGGPCVDPPVAGYGQITWEKAVSTTADGVSTETDTASISLQASPGMQAPSVPAYAAGPLPGSTVYFGPSCPIPGFRSLGAGTVTVQGPGLAPVTAPVAPLRQGAGERSDDVSGGACRRRNPGR